MAGLSCPVPSARLPPLPYRLVGPNEPNEQSGTALSTGVLGGYPEIKAKWNRGRLPHSAEQERLALAAIGNHADLSDQLAGHFARDIGEPEVSTLESIGQLGVIETENVQDCGVQVVDMDAVFDHVESQFVALSD